jgi:hypothetical protein
MVMLMEQRPPRRKKAPWTPGDPIPGKVEREFDFPPVAPPPPPETPPKPPAPRRAAALFTLPEEREALVEFAVADLKRRGIAALDRGDIIIHGTTVDKNLSPVEYEALCWFLDIHTISDTRDGGRAPTQGFEAYTYIVDRLPEPFLVFLDWVGRCQYPKRYGPGKPASKLTMARGMFQPTEEKYLRGGIDGYLQAIAQAIAHARAERETLVERRTIRLEYLRGGKPR